MVSNPMPLMVRVDALAAKFAVLSVTPGVTVPTCEVVLVSPLVATLAVKLPAIGLVEKVTVRDVAVAEVTVPTAPLLKFTELFSGVVSKPAPVIVIVDELAARLAVLLVMLGVMDAICTAEPLEMLLVVTIAVRLPRPVGLVLNVTVSDVRVAVVTVPTAPLLKTTVLLPAIGSKAKPLITMEGAAIPSAVVLSVTEGVTEAT